MKIWTVTKSSNKTENFERVCAEVQSPGQLVVPQKKHFLKYYVSDKLKDP